MYQITNIDKKLMLINIMYITTLFSLFTKLECKILSYQKLSLKLSLIWGHFSKFYNSYNPLFVKRVVVSFE